MQRRYWYAVRKSHGNEDLSHGSRSYQEAMNMLEKQGCGFISVVARDLNYIEGEIKYEEFFGKE